MTCAPRRDPHTSAYSTPLLARLQGSSENRKSKRPVRCRPGCAFRPQKKMCSNVSLMEMMTINKICLEGQPSVVVVNPFLICFFENDSRTEEPCRQSLKKGRPGKREASSARADEKQVPRGSLLSFFLLALDWAQRCRKNSTFL